MTRKNFQLVLAGIAQARQEAKVAALNFGVVFGEMKKRGFSHLLQEIAVAKQHTKTAELAKRLQLIQMEAQEAGIDLESICAMPVVMPQVVPVTGDISRCSDSITMAIPVPKEQ
ncbi:hypothetical protein PHYSODRAFT_337491 [Phytophthora sojae]|uniref:Uncharacterized protein n=1 Tax=Phytophthora sojae (strain P6497) TaxID=1094619 RepID=G5A1B7_PHYSP|nr:hypothetical protein PHYSODRAFT_337491 [Phytophthora sojae]EGZ10716.1 hypothetical protein PHYSODRAFT_337491 [Phytophthora sojae]|eukprot:XP_009533461.1 hypothetical protein PHYSODRAFT_337491 [Phytophthora sojae]